MTPVTRETIIIIRSAVLIAGYKTTHVQYRHIHLYGMLCFEIHKILYYQQVSSPMATVLDELVSATRQTVPLGPRQLC